MKNFGISSTEFFFFFCFISGLGKGRKFTQTIGGSRKAAWLRKNTLKLRRKR